MKTPAKKSLKKDLGKKKHFVVTGASSGIGEATWKLLASKGFHVTAIARREEKLSTIAQEIESAGGSCSWLTCDLSDLDAVAELAHKIILRTGPIEGVVFNAGICFDKYFDENLAKHRTAEMNLNYFSPCAMLDVFLPQAKGQRNGHFIAVGSLSAVTSFPGNATYAASKSALASLWQSLGHEYSRYGIHFSLVMPGLTRTEMTENFKTFMPMRDPESVARLVFESYQNPGLSKTFGVENRAILTMARVFPETTQNLISRFQTILVPRKG